MPAFIADFAAWRSDRNRKRAEAILAAAATAAKSANERARWWNGVRVWACGLGRWPGFSTGKG